MTFRGSWTSGSGASIPLRDGGEVSDEGWRHRIRPGRTREPSWAIERATADGWQLMHLFDELPVRPVDVAMGHHWTSTHPTSHFTTGLSFGRRLPGEQVGIALEGDGWVVTIRRPGAPTRRREVGWDEGVALLQELGKLSGEEIERLPVALDMAAGAHCGSGTRTKWGR